MTALPAAPPPPGTSLLTILRRRRGLIEVGLRVAFVVVLVLFTILQIGRASCRERV